MRRLAALALSALLLACGDAPSEGRGVESQSPPPAGAESPLPEPPAAPVEDLVLVTIDTLRADALGFMGNERTATPTLDRLAASGWVFDNARAHNVLTLPSHANILTGLHPYEHGIRDNKGFVLADSVPTAATLLSAAGFATAAFVAAFPLDSRFGLDRGFDVYDDDYPIGSSPTHIEMPERGGDEVIGRALEWWRGQGDRRRFLWVHLYEPHAPYEPPEPFASRNPDAPYRGEVEAVDAFLAPLLAPFLDGGERPALVVVTSDHGEALGEHGERTHGLFAYEETIHAPLVVWGGGIGAGRTRHPARHVDLLSTMLAAAGVERPAAVAGRALFAGAGSAPAAESEAQYFEALSATFDAGFAPLRGVVHDGHKFISLPLPELYDLEDDPAESRNLVEAERDRLRALARLLPDESVWPPRRGEVSREAADALRALGYLTGSAADKTEFGPEDDPKNLVHLDAKLHKVVESIHLGERERGERLAREVIDERPSMGLAWYLLSQMMLDRGATAEAVATMEKAVELGAASDSLQRQLGLSLAEVGRYADALTALQPFGDSDDPDVLNALGLILSEAGRQQEARAALERLLARDPRNARALENLAVVELRSERWSEAARNAQRAVDLDPGLGQAWNYLGTARYNTGDPRGAVTAWEQAVAVEPDNFDALYNLALVAAQIGDAGRARRALERFIAAAPSERYGPDIERARAMLRQLPGTG